jgi:PAS domain S-box-containing protein
MLEDNDDDAAMIRILLQKEKWNCEFRLSVDRETYQWSLDQFHPDIILADHSLPQFNSEEALAIARQQYPGIPFIMVTGSASEEFAANITKLGADDYILKDRMHRLPAAIMKALKLREIEKEKTDAAAKLKHNEENYRVIMERVSDGFVALDKDWQYTYANKKAGEILQRKPEELIDTAIWTEFSEEISPAFFHAYLKALKEQKYVHLEEFYRPLSIWLENFIYPSPDGLSIFFKDITDRKRTEKIIIENEVKYRTLVDHAFDSIIIYTRDFIIIDCNQRACRTLGYSQSELKEQNVSRLFFEEDLVARPFYFESLQSGARTLDYRRVKKKDGSAVEMEIGTKMMPDGNLMAMGRDITERKKAEQKIIQSETNLRTIFENTSEGFLLLDKDAVVLAFNSKATTYSFFSQLGKFQVGQSLFHFIEEARKEFVGEIITKVLSGESIQYDRSYEKKDGSIAWIDFSATPVIDKGLVCGICISGRDITEKKIIEQQREFDRSNLEALINNTNDPMWSVDRHYNLITSNEAFNKRVNAISGQVLARGTYILAGAFNKEQLDRFRRCYDRAFSGESFTEIVEDSSPVYSSSENSFYPIYNGNRIIGAACFSRNITERKKAEENLKLLENKILEQKIQEQKKIARAIIKAQEKERNYIGQELHDNINQLLAVIKLYLVAAGEKNEEVKGIINYPVELLDNSIEEIRLLGYKLVTPLKNIDLASLISNILGKLEENTAVKTTFIYSVSGDKLTDDLKLNIYRIVQEQINNILKYAEAKVVMVAVTEKNNFIALIISDDGNGFDVTKKRAGIGISNMINRIESFNGKIVITSQPGDGCKIEIMIPF